MQRRGLEWLYRLSREPRRLGPRYLRDNPAFLSAFLRQWLAERG
jgi:UDP-N-acetyl-D-mannosaminuronic acid transferase (WecB/TagA/CpsF family)